MKHNSFITFAFFFCITTITACVDDSLKWDYRGTISRGDANAISLEMENVYQGVSHDDALFVIGFKIDDAGINHPTVARVSDDLKKLHYWPFSNLLQQLFVFENSLYLLDGTGAVFQYENQNWKKDRLMLFPESRVIRAEKDIIACYPSSLLKSGNRIGACYSVKRKWKVPVNWRKIEPKICDDRLIIFETVNREMFIRTINITNGKIMVSRTLAKEPQDLCSACNPL